MAPMEYGSCGVEDLAGLVRGEERIHLLWSGISTRSVAWVRMKPSMQTMTGTETSSARRKAWMCRSAASWIRLGEELDPSGVAGGHGVAVVVPYVDGCADGPVGQGHDDREPEPAGVVDRLHHEQQTLARRGGEGTGAGGGGADGDRHRGEFRFHVDELARRQLARLHQLARAPQ